MKQFKKVLALISVLCIVSTLGCCGKVGGDDLKSSSSTDNSQVLEGSSETSSEDDENIYTINAVYPQEQAEINIFNETMSNWYNAYTSIDSMCSSRQYNPTYTDVFAPNSVKLTWDCSHTTNNYKLIIATNQSLEGAKVYRTTGKSLTLKNLFTNTQYYWQIEASFNGKDVVSDVYSFKTLETRRTIDVEGVSNTRDLGGLMTSSGMRMKQGVVYRGARLDYVTPAGSSTMRKDLNIKTVLDLRSPTNETNGAKVSALGQSINYINVDATDVFYRNIFSRKDVIKAELKVFTNPNNYPIYFHCSAGRDRTGALAYLLGALCGVDEIDLYRDFEMTFFSSAGCSDFNNSTKDRLKDLVDSFHEMNTLMKENFEGDTLQEKTTNYLLSVGMTLEEIQTIKNMLLAA